MYILYTYMVHIRHYSISISPVVYIYAFCTIYIIYGGYTTRALFEAAAGAHKERQRYNTSIVYTI